MRYYSRIIPLLGLFSLVCPVYAQTINLGYTAGTAQFSGSSADYTVTISSSSAQSSLALTSGAAVSGVDLGELSFTETGRGPNGLIETIPFSFTRPLSLSVNGAPAVTETEALSGTWGAEQGGSVGQYLVTNFVLNGNSTTYDFGSLGRLQADFQPGQAFDDGLGGGPTTIPITANLTYLAPAAVPEPSSVELLSLGALALFGAALHLRKRRGQEA